MNKKKVTLSKSMVAKQRGVVVLPLGRWQRMKKENFELRSAVKAILEGEIALKEGKTRTFKAFLKEKFSSYAENI